MVTAILLAAAACSPLLRVFGSAGLRLIVMAVPASSAAAAVAWSWLGRLNRDPRSLLPAMGGFVAGLAAGALPGMLLAAPDPFGPAALGPRLQQAVSDGWYRLLSVPVPVPYTRSFTDLPFLLAAAFAAVIMLTALGRHPAAAVLPATLGFGGLLILGVDGPAAGPTLAGGFALAVLIFLLSVAPFAGYRAAVAAVVSGAVLVAATVLLAGVVHPGPPYDPRSTLRVPLNVTVSQDPLALLSARLETPDAQVLTAQLSGSLVSRLGDWNWIELTYDTYDGAGWQAAGYAKPAVTGTAVPDAIGTGSAQVTMARPTALLPHPAYVLGTNGEDLGYDPGTEMLASPSAVSDYSVRVSVAEPSPAELTAAALPSGAPAGLTQVPSCAPAALSTLAREVRGEASAPGDQAARLELLLKSAPFRYDQAAAPGEGCGSINNMLASRKGTSAQFATAFVLAARLLGIPARVAVGYLPGRVSGDTDTVTDADAYAWPQVELTGVGWVDFDPTPKSGAGGHAPARETQPAVQKLQVKQPDSNPVSTPAIAPPPRPAAGVSVMARVFMGLAALVALVLSWMTAVWLRSRRRRLHRRRAAEPAARVLGAWDEFLIPLGQAGAPIRGRTAPSVAVGAAAIIPDEAHCVGQLATLAERALYDEISERDAAMAWQLSDRARGLAAAAASRRARLRRVFVPPRATR
ncbi:MAG: transglutaminase-like domain-containing protein [Streptosporangiaceae bacterium]